LQGLRALAQAALAAEFERGGALHLQAHQFGLAAAGLLGATVALRISQ